MLLCPFFTILNSFFLVVNQQLRHSTVGFVALEGLVRNVCTSIRYENVDKNLGNSFDPNTGIFTAPVDGLYIVSLTIEQTGDVLVTAGVTHYSAGNRIYS